MSEVSIPVATMVGAELSHDSIKTLSDSYREFCEDDEEYENSISPIEQDPEPYANGTKKTRPILKKYAQALLDKIILDQQLEAEAEAQRDVNLTPQQVKADMKIYVSSCEKKIAQQQEQCDALQKQVDQLSEIVRCMVTWSDESFISLLSHVSTTETTSMDYFISHLKREEPNATPVYGHIISSIHYAIYSKKIENVKKLLDAGVNINLRGHLFKNGSHIYKNTDAIYRPDSLYSPLEIASYIGSLEIVKLLIEQCATIANNVFKVPNGPEGDLVAGYLQTHGSKPVTRF